jgi:hypothetical protein
MQTPITVNYTPDGDDWTVTVVGEAARRSAKATGLIAARDQADQIVAQLAPKDQTPTVVHLLDGDAFAFTNTYLHARLGLSPQAAEEPAARMVVEPPTEPQLTAPAPLVPPAAEVEPKPVAEPVGTPAAPAAEPDNAADTPAEEGDRQINIAAAST